MTFGTFGGYGLSMQSARAETEATTPADVSEAQDAFKQAKEQLDIDTKALASKKSELAAVEAAIDEGSNANCNLCGPDCTAGCLASTFSALRFARDPKSDEYKKTMTAIKQNAVDSCWMLYDELGESISPSPCKDQVLKCDRVKNVRAKKRLDSQIVKLEEEIKALKTEVSEKRRALARAKEGCADCQLEAQKAQMKSIFREPTTGELIVAGIGAATPLLMGGLGAYMGIRGMNQYSGMYNNYLNTCSTMGIPCSAPGMGGMAYGMGGLGMMGMGLGMGGLGMLGMGMGGSMLGMSGVLGAYGMTGLGMGGLGMMGMGMPGMGMYGMGIPGMGMYGGSMLGMSGILGGYGLTGLGMPGLGMGGLGMMGMGMPGMGMYGMGIPGMGMYGGSMLGMSGILGGYGLTGLGMGGLGMMGMGMPGMGALGMMGMGMPGMGMAGMTGMTGMIGGGFPGGCEFICGPGMGMYGGSMLGMSGILGGYGMPGLGMYGINPGPGSIFAGGLGMMGMPNMGMMGSLYPSGSLTGGWAMPNTGWGTGFNSALFPYGNSQYGNLYGASMQYAMQQAQRQQSDLMLAQQQAWEAQQRVGQIMSSGAGYGYGGGIGYGNIGGGTFGGSFGIGASGFMGYGLGTGGGMRSF
jgi:hypothetical protein